MSHPALTDELINRVTWKIPNALALVGSRAGDERNAMTTSWITQLSMAPVLIGVGVDNTAVTHRLIESGGSFTVNLWDAANTRPFVKFSKPATYEAAGNGAGDSEGTTSGALNGWRVYEAATGAPVFADAAAWTDCEVRQSMNLGTHTLFIGELAAAGINHDDVHIASMSHTRMKYGGVKRH
ncbi:flavin reductase family protein [Candidatus Poriferisodalis sp.]|uniref:flavin reductase family protein n=1 Tax=Candidatus Poriferisodalis sp. TaxID=3101277 RepID=UPI003B0251F3